MRSARWRTASPALRTWGVQASPAGPRGAVAPGARRMHVPRERHFLSRLQNDGLREWRQLAGQHFAGDASGVGQYAIRPPALASAAIKGTAAVRHCGFPQPRGARQRRGNSETERGRVISWVARLAPKDVVSQEARLDVREPAASNRLPARGRQTAGRAMMRRVRRPRPSTRWRVGRVRGSRTTARHHRAEWLGPRCPYRGECACGLSCCGHAATL